MSGAPPALAPAASLVYAFVSRPRTPDRRRIMADFTLRVNGAARKVTAVAPDTPLLYVLRTDLLDGKSARSCSVPVSVAAKSNITTLEGLGTIEKLHPLQRAFIEEQACQCGYCSNGMIMAAKALLDGNPRPSESDIKRALNDHLCRCASHNRIVRAVQRAAKEMA